ncbi:ABC transporter ATP-binding protein [Secundilactobacillus collinoides]|uniref:ABC superfamily ATP binding cassette transporter, ABC protein n=2 Tax=Secundilactobacillus collinoides TaxID=33960 RepID=A0A0R2BBD3_SECCO|nr:ABC transporter ATP-binding protein [Secundilactobacillus collinoides]KRM75874.1 ABC superfamily ATP binding cassette transporter, ABC protein [Secundilactobacillus collinoides DSM 20515 = JCM 1123]KZL37142.1 molybdenum ABC transporter ATP-binding protein [Secundilactobacillus collinoides]
MNRILKFDDVSVTRGKKQILKHLDWEVHNGENWAILGLNGAGKTTMLKMIQGDLWPTSGKLEVLGGVFGHISIPELKTKVGWVSTALQDQLHAGDVVDSIVLSGKFASIGVYQEFTKRDLQEARQTLIDLGGEKLLGKPYAVLSQGERQLVLIARAMMAKPQLLILDEPCNGLDLFAREELLNRVAGIAEMPNHPALLLVSHYTEEMLPCFKHVLLLRHGEIVQKGRREEMLTADTLSEFYGKPIQTVSMRGNRLAVYPK